ncbi:MAG: RES family NAD+ phosphorylase [Methylocystaceae bacterium]|nr:RES family NAD+ phosphorylase [Methylocystaceae bacterium]
MTTASHFSTSKVRNLDRRFKARCVGAGVFFPKLATERAEEKYLKKAGITSGVSQVYWSGRLRVAIDADIRDLIHSNISYWFSGEHDLYSPGRYNGDDFPVLYTAKEIETAKNERFFHLREKDKPFDYVVFSVSASGNMIDIRGMTTLGGVPLEDAPYNECQKIAREIIEDTLIDCEGIISFSARNSGGSCCNFFRIEEVLPGEIIEDGTLSIQ